MASLKKTLDMAAAGGVLLQEQVDKILQSIIEHKEPLRQNLPRKKGAGREWIVVQRIAEPSAGWYADTDTISDTESSYTRLTFEYKTLAVAGKVSRKLQATGQTYGNIKAMEIEAGLAEIKEKEEWGIIWGDKSKDPKQFDGLNVLISGSQVVAVSGALSLQKLDEAFDLCHGKPDMIICSKRTRKELASLLQAQQRFIDRVEVKGGFKLLSYNDVPIYVSTQIKDDQVYGSYTNASTLFIVDTSKVWIGELTPLTMKAVDATTTQYDKFEIFEDIALVVANYKYCAKVEGIVPPS